MKGNKSLNIALACLLVLSVTACSSDDVQQESNAAQGSESVSMVESTESSIQGEPQKDEPALDWSAVETAPEEDFRFHSTSIGPKANAVKGMCIDEYLGEGGVVKIPNTYQGLPVILIDGEAFKDSDVTDVYFEAEGFVYIQSWAFQDCTSLNSVVIKGGEQTEIRDWVFQGCTNLTSIVLSEEITNFGTQTFTDTPWLENNHRRILL